MIGKCKYCGIELKDKANIRCDVCDRTWQEGYIMGKECIRMKFREVSNAFKNLIEGGE